MLKLLWIFFRQLVETFGQFFISASGRAVYGAHFLGAFLCRLTVAHYTSHYTVVDGIENGPIYQDDDDQVSKTGHHA